MSSESSAADAHWVCPGADRLVYEHLDGDGDVALFQPDSGQTHFLTRMAALVLERLATGPATVDAMLDFAGVDPADSDYADVRESIIELLEDLQDRALVVRAAATQPEH